MVWPGTPAQKDNADLGFRGPPASALEQRPVPSCPALLSLFPWIQPNSSALAGLTLTTLLPQPLRCLPFRHTGFCVHVVLFGIWFYFYGTKDGTQGLGHTRQTL